MVWGGQQLKITIELVRYRFQTQTNVIAFDIALNILPKARPIVFPADEFSYFIDTEMACRRVVVMSADKFDSNDFWHKR